MKNIKKIVSMVITILLVLCLISLIYLCNYYKAEEHNLSFNGKDVKVINKDNGYYFDGPNEKDLVIFYPGAKVEGIAYIKLLFELSKSYDCYLVEMPFRLALLNKNAASDIIKKYDYQNYYLMGHSLGGAVASMYVSNRDDVKGLILLAAYPTKELNENIKLLSIYGSEDKVLNLKKYNENKKYWNKNSKEVVIKGGNHANFGNYGRQKKDGKATISSKEQQEETIKAIVEFIK